MSERPGAQLPQVSRRRLLRTASGAAVIGSLGAKTVTPVAADPGTQQWAFKTGDSIISSPTVVDGTVFVGSRDNSLYAVDAETGTEEWAFETGDPIGSSPAVVDGTVFVLSLDQNLYAVDAETGTEEWAFETWSGDQFGPGVRSSPAVVDGTVFIGSHSGNLYAVDAETGTEQWAFETGRQVYSSPTVVDGTVFVGSWDGNLYAVDTETGTEEWAFETGDWVNSSPTVVDGTVFVGSQDNNLYAVDAETGTQQWAFETGDEVRSSPMVVDGTVFVGSQDNNLYAVDAETGTQQWAFETGRQVISSPTVVGGTVFVGSQDNNLYAIDAETGTEEWAFETGRQVMSSPTVVNGTVFVGSDDNNLYAVDAGVTGSSEGSEEIESGPGITFIPNTSLEVISAGIGVGGLVGAGYAGWRYLSADDAAAKEVDDVPTATDSTITTSGESGPHDSQVARPSSTEDAGTDPTESQAENHRAMAGELLEEAATAKSNSEFDVAIDAYEAALREYQTALDKLDSGATKKQENIENTIETTRDGLETVKSQREAYQEAEAELQAIASTLTTGETALDDGDAKQALEQFETAAETLDTVSSSIQEHKFDGLTDQIEELRTQCQSGRDAAESILTTSGVPETIPSSESQPITYTDIDKGDAVGRGGNADVYYATAATDSGPVELALKEPRMSGTLHTDEIERMLEEAETWQQLDDHDHIVSVVDYGSEPLPWIGMEYMDAGHLGDRAGTLDTEQALWTAIVTTKAVRHAHRRGIAHLDLKPENVLFRSVDDAWDVPKIADWGLSKQLLQHSKSVEGMSPHYAAPEQFADKYGDADDITDIYQLGAVFYELFTGRPPFQGNTFEVVNQIQADDPTPPSDFAEVPAEIDDILLTALATNKEDRYEDVIFLRNDLQDLFDSL